MAAKTPRRFIAGVAHATREDGYTRMTHKGLSSVVVPDAQYEQLLSKAGRNAAVEAAASVAQAEAAYWRERHDGLLAAVELGQTQAMATAQAMSVVARKIEVEIERVGVGLSLKPLKRWIDDLNILRRRYEASEESWVYPLIQESKEPKP